MKILVINGSPRGSKSNTLKVTDAFIKGISAVTDCLVEKVELKNIKIEGCLGCYSCWSKTPGRCVINDDEKALIDKMLASDIVIYSFPLFYYSLPSKLKAVVERQLPTVAPFMKGQGTYFVNGGHPSRFNSNYKTVLISTCGFYPTSKSYDAVRAQFNMICGDGGYTEVFIGEGELFAKQIAQRRCNARLEVVERAGKEFAELGAITPETVTEMTSHIFPPDMYAAMADEGWGIGMEDFRQNDNEVIDKVEELGKKITTIY